MANLRNDVKGPDGKVGMKGREVIAKLVARSEKEGTQTGYYMNAQLAQYNGSPAAKGNAQSQPQLAKAHEFKTAAGEMGKSYDVRITKDQYDGLIAKSKSYKVDEKTVIAGFKADLMKSTDNGILPKFDSVSPTTSKAFNDKAWQNQVAATAGAYKKGAAAREAAKTATAEVETPVADMEAEA